MKTIIVAFCNWGMLTFNREASSKNSYGGLNINISELNRYGYFFMKILGTQIDKK